MTRQKARSRRILGWMWWVLASVLVAVAFLCVYVTQPLLGLERRPSGVRADPAQLRTHVEALCSLSPRTGAHRDNLDRAADYIRARFAAEGVEVSFQPHETEPYRNVIARLGPDTRERIVVGAHYDAAGPGVGADDNASGVAALLELARILRSGELPMRIELVAYALEEPPFFRTRFMGSFVHADGLRRSGAAVRAMICLEMIGFYSDSPGSQRYPLRAMGLLYPSKGDFIAVAGCLGQAGLVRRVKRAMAESATLRVRSINAPRFVPGVDFSDHLNYWDAGFPAVMVTDTAFYRNPNYHLATDTHETLDYPRMALVVEQVYGAVQALGR